MQMDDQYPYEAPAPLITLVCAWPQDGAARLRTGGLSLQQLLEQLLGLCGAQRGALLLPRAPSVALALAAFSTTASLAEFRTLATCGMSQEDLLPLLATFALAGADGQISAETAGWMFCHLPLASPIQSAAPAGLFPAEPSNSA
jgi:hypothetical protein